jgi:hypothetical protein
MKQKYSAEALGAVLRRLYPNEPIGEGYGISRLLRHAAFDLIGGALLVTPVERDMIVSACIDIKRVGHLRFAKADEVVSEVLSVEQARYLHFSSAAERALQDVFGDAVRVISPVYDVSLTEDGTVQAVKLVLTKGDIHVFTALFSGVDGTIKELRLEIAGEHSASVVKSDDDRVSAISEWSASHIPAPRKIAA